MGQSTQIHPLGSKVHGPQLHMGLQEESFLGTLQFHEAGKLFIFPGDNGTAQNEQLGIKRNGISQSRIVDGDL